MPLILGRIGAGFPLNKSLTFKSRSSPNHLKPGRILAFSGNCEGGYNFPFTFLINRIPLIS